MLREVHVDGFFHIGVNRNGGKIVYIPPNISYHLYVAEAENSKFRLIVICAIFCGVMHLLERRSDLGICALDVFKGQLPISVNKLAKSEMKLLARLCIDGKFNVSGNILTEVKYPLYGGTYDKLSLEFFMLC